MSKVNFINPIPPKKQEQIVRWYTSSIIATSLLMIILSSITVLQIYKILVIKQTQKKLKTSLKNQNAIIEKHSQLQKQEKNLKKQQKKIETYRKHDRNPAIVLKELSSIIPGDIALSSYKQNKHDIELEGQTLQTSCIMNFLDKLNKSSYFENMRIQSLHQEQANKEGRSFVRFAIKGKIKSH